MTSSLEVRGPEELVDEVYSGTVPYTNILKSKHKSPATEGDRQIMPNCRPGHRRA